MSRFAKTTLALTVVGCPTRAVLLYVVEVGFVNERQLGDDTDTRYDVRASRRWNRKSW